MGEGQWRGLELTAEAEKGGCCDIQDIQMKLGDSGQEAVSGQIGMPCTCFDGVSDRLCQ